MKYEEFLFTELLKLSNKSFDKLPYDTMYELGIELYKDFLIHDTDTNAPLYESILEYINTNLISVQFDE